MSNELEKWRKHDNALDVERRLMNEALAGLTRTEIKKHGGGQELVVPPRQVAVERVDVIDVPRVCAVHDKGYIATYRRGSNGLYSLAKTARLSKGHAGSGGVSVTLRSEDIDRNSAGECCAWCGARQMEMFGRLATTIRCGECEAFVCLGRTVKTPGYSSSWEFSSSSSFDNTGRYSYSSSSRFTTGNTPEEIVFHCRASCGFSGPVSDTWVNSQGTQRKQATAAVFGPVSRGLAVR